MSSQYPRRSRVTLMLVFLLAMGLAALAPGDAAASPVALPLAQESPTPTPTAQILTDGALAPCNLRGDHSIDPRVVKEGDAVTVSAEYDYNCITQGTRQVDLLLVLEDTGILRLERDRAGEQPVTNLKEAIGRFVIAIDPTNDSRVGMIKYGPNWTGAPTIGKGEEHFQLFLDNVNRVRGSTGPCANPASALRAASGMINSLSKPDPTDPPSVMIIIDAGAPPCSGVPPSQQADLQNACDAAKAEQVTVALVSLAESNGRMRGCNTRGWYYRSSSETGADLPAVFEELRDRILRDLQPIETVYSDFFNTLYWEYVFGSGAPRDPDAFFGDLIWSEAVPQQPKIKHTYSYQMRSLTAPAEVPITLDPGPAVILQFPQRGDTWYLPQETVCVYRDGRKEQDCGNFIRIMTQEAWTPTPRPTETPTGPSATPVPSETPVPSVTPTSAVDTPEPADTPTPTVEDDTPTIFLPVAKRGVE